ncbi:MAG: TIGR03936 family radical SAM-associated protein, partial [Planctomycetota bacterium]
MSGHWGVWFTVTGDPRFLSHHDLMRLMARAAARAGMPLKHSAGFNPRPKLSLVLPRPVGVASRCELMAVQLTRPVDPDQV